MAMLVITRGYMFHQQLELFHNEWIGIGLQFALSALLPGLQAEPSFKRPKKKKHGNGNGQFFTMDF